MSIVVQTEMQAKPEAIDELKSLLKKSMPEVRAYDGCQGVDVYSN